MSHSKEFSSKWQDQDSKLVLSMSKLMPFLVPSMVPHMLKFREVLSGTRLGLIPHSKDFSLGQGT